MNMHLEDRSRGEGKKGPLPELLRQSGESAVSAQLNFEVDRELMNRSGSTPWEPIVTTLLGTALLIGLQIPLLAWRKTND